MSYDANITECEKKILNFNSGHVLNTKCMKKSGWKYDTALGIPDTEFCGQESQTQIFKANLNPRSHILKISPVSRKI